MRSPFAALGHFGLSRKSKLNDRLRDEIVIYAALKESVPAAEYTDERGNLANRPTDVCHRNQKEGRVGLGEEDTKREREEECNIRGQQKLKGEKEKLKERIHGPQVQRARSVT